MIRTAILIDGAFYCKRAKHLYGPLTPRERAEELKNYCNRHIAGKGAEERSSLYRVFYYDCPPSSKKVFHPLLKKTVDLAKSSMFRWSADFQKELVHLRKFALRSGVLADEHANYNLNPDAVKRLLAGKLSTDELCKTDFVLDMKQKGVDMRIGIDIASMSIKHLVDRIILIAGDSDFVPAAKMARREGIDFILDPMWAPIRPDLFEHIDGLRTYAPRTPGTEKTQRVSSNT